MEAKLWIPLLFALSVLMSSVSADSIKPLPPIAGTVASEVNITCDATITSASEGIRLKKLLVAGGETTIVQLLPPNFDQQPADTAKYQLTKTSLHAFYITIKDVVFEDAARYRCSLILQDTIQELTTVVIVRAPIIQIPDKIQAGHMTQIICDAEYQAPFDLSESTEKEKFPELAASIGDVWLSGGTMVKETGRIQTTWNTTLGAADNQKSLVCKVFTNTPSYEQTKTKTVNIIFDVQNINLGPEKETYAVGEEINCTAEGNPAPTIKWRAITTNTMGTNIGANLLILDTMMGDKKENWKCEASSSSTGTKIEKTIEFVVVAVKPTDPPIGPNKESPTAAIAAGVTVPLVIIIAVVIVVIVVIMRKKKQKTDKPPAGDAEGNISSGPFTNPVAPDDDQHNKPNNKPTAYQSEKPSVPPHQKPYPDNTTSQNFGYQPSKYDNDPNVDMSAEMARRALTPLPIQEADYDIPYNDERGQPRLADVASYAAPPAGPPPRGPPAGGTPPEELPPDQQYSVVHRPPPTPTDYPDMAAAHPGLQQVYNMPKPRAVPRPPADTTV